MNCDQDIIYLILAIFVFALAWVLSIFYKATKWNLVAALTASALHTAAATHTFMTPVTYLLSTYYAN